MTRLSIILIAMTAALAAPSSGHAQGKIEPVPNRAAFAVVQPPARPFATVPIRQTTAADKPQLAPTARRNSGSVYVDPIDNAAKSQPAAQQPPAQRTAPPPQQQARTAPPAAAPATPGEPPADGDTAKSPDDNSEPGTTATSDPGDAPEQNTADAPTGDQPEG